MSRDNPRDSRYRRRAKNNEKVLNRQNLVDWAELGKVTCDYEKSKMYVCIVFILFKSKRRGCLIVKLKALESRENIICYLSSYLCSSKPPFFCSHSTSHHHYHHYPKSLIPPQVIESSSHWALKPLRRALRYWVVIKIVTKQVCANRCLVGVLCC